MKKTKKIRYKRRLLIYSSLTALILFTITDYYFETFGLPNFVAIYFQEQFYKKGLEVKFEKIKILWRCKMSNNYSIFKAVEYLKSKGKKTNIGRYDYYIVSEKLKRVYERFENWRVKWNMQNF